MSRSSSILGVLFATSAIGLNTTTPYKVLTQPLVEPEPLEVRWVPLADTIDQHRRRLQIPGVAAAVVENGEVVWCGSFGNLTPRSQVNIASITKTMGAVLAMQQVASGRLDLEEIAPGFRYVRLKHLLSHTSGGSSGSSSGANTSGGAANAGAANAGAGNGGGGNEGNFNGVVFSKSSARKASSRGSVSAAKRAGASFRYDNKRYGLLTPILQQRGNATLATLMRQRIFEPAGMAHTQPSNSVVGGVVSTVEDLARYVAALDGNQLLDEASKERMWTPLKPTLPYGLGWFVQHINGVKVVWHYGRIATSSSLIVKIPSRRLSLVVLANSPALGGAFSLANVALSPVGVRFLDTSTVGRDEEAADLLEQRPNDPEAILLAGRYYERTGRSEFALVTYERLALGTSGIGASDRIGPLRSIGPPRSIGASDRSGEATSPGVASSLVVASSFGVASSPGVANSWAAKAIYRELAEHYRCANPRLARRYELAALGDPRKR